MQTLACILAGYVFGTVSTFFGMQLLGAARYNDTEFDEPEERDTDGENEQETDESLPKRDEAEGRMPAEKEAAGKGGH